MICALCSPAFWRRAIAIATIPLVAGCATPGDAPIASMAAPPDRQTSLAINGAAVDAVIDGYIESEALPLLYVRVEDRSGTVIYEHGAANAALVPEPQIDGDTWFRIWSMSKIVTISAALDMIEDGLIAFDTPIATYLPELANLRVAVDADGESYAERSSASYFSAEMKDELAALACPLRTVSTQRDITVRDLLNHEAGFYYATTQIPCLDSQVTDAGFAQATSAADFLTRLADLPLIQQPGTTYYYGLNTTVLGMLLERVAGKPLPEVVQERITDPLAIEDLRYRLPRGAALMPRYTGADGTLRVAGAEELDIFGAPPPDYDDASGLYLGGEGMVATTAAYADFLQMLLGRGESRDVRVLDEMTIEALTTPKTQLDSEWGVNGWNLWINSGKLNGGGEGVAGLWIGGGYEGTHFWVDQERGLLGLVMTQVHIPPPAAATAQETIREAIYANLDSPAR